MTRRTSILTTIEEKKYFSGIYQKSTINRYTSSLEKASACTKLQFLEYGFWTVLAIGIQNVVGGTFFGNWAFPDGSDPYVCSNDANDLEIGTHNRNICGVYRSLDIGSKRFIVLSAFIVGGFVVSSVKLWLVRRSAYTAVTGSIRNILLNISSIVDNDHLHEKNLMSRWVMVCFELSILNGRELMDTDEAREYLEELNLIKSNEWDDMINGDRHTSALFWVQVKARELEKAGVINNVEYQTLCNAVTLARATTNDVMSCTARDQPPPYVFVCASLININLLLHSVMTGLKWAIWMYDSNENTGSSVWLEPRMSIDVCVLFFFTCIYGMLFDLCTCLYNPFGPRTIDIDSFKGGQQLRLLAKGLCRKPYPNTMFSDTDRTIKASWPEEEECQDETEEDKKKKASRREMFDFALSMRVKQQNKSSLRFIFANNRKQRSQNSEMLGEF
jgi:hypothetical protein